MARPGVGEAKAALDAAVQSSRDIQDYGDPLSVVVERNEPWVHSYVGTRLNDLARRRHGDRTRRVYITYESRVSWINDQTCRNEAWPTGRPPGGLRGGQRFDLAQWSNRDVIEGLVEIKNAPGMDDKRFAQDAWRLAWALRRWGVERGGTLKWGIYLFSNRIGGESKRDCASQELKNSHARRVRTVRQALDAFRIGAYHRPVEEGDAGCAMSWSALLIRPDPNG